MKSIIIFTIVALLSSCNKKTTNPTPQTTGFSKNVKIDVYFAGTYNNMSVKWSFNPNIDSVYSQMTQHYKTVINNTTSDSILIYTGSSTPGVGTQYCTVTVYVDGVQKTQYQGLSINKTIKL